MTHADAVREAKERVVECADALLEEGPHELKTWSDCCRRDCDRCKSDKALYSAAAELRSLVAQTCVTCGGTGLVEFHEDVRGRGPCPAACDNGKRTAALSPSSDSSKEADCD